MVRLSRRKFLGAAVGVTGTSVLTGQSLPRGASFLRCPNIQNVTSNEATLIWTGPRANWEQVLVTDPQGASMLFETSVEAFYPDRTGLDAPYFQYRATLNGLVSGERYRYEIISDGARVAAPIQRRLEFRTEDGGDFRFVHFADAGEGSPEQHALSRQMQGESIDFVVANGDLAYDLATHASIEANYYGVYRELMAQVPFFSTLGNHEYYTDGGHPSLSGRAYPTRGVPQEDHGRYYSFDWGNAHFVALDSNWPLEFAAQGKSEMLRWLDEDLGSTRKFWRIAVFHHPGYATGKHQFSAEAARVRELIVPILERHGVQLVLNGHEHTYQRTHELRGGDVVPPDSGGIVYVTSGGGGAQTHYFEPDGRVAKSLGLNHYVYTEVSGGTLHLRVRGLNSTDDLDAVALRPKPRIRAVVNAASFTSDIAGGSVVAIFGTNLFPEAIAGSVTESRGCSVSWNGEFLPIVYGDAMQINVRIPAERSASGNIEVRTRNGSAEWTVGLSDVAPALFANPGDPECALALSSQGTLLCAETPANPGQPISLFATGLREDVEVRVRFGDSEVPAAAVPSAYPGIWQVDTQLPSSAGSEGIPVQLTAGGAASNILAVPVL